jgi:hypothetical protein
VALNNTRAVIEAFLGVRNVFQRTPKFRIEARGDRWFGSQYALPLDGMTVGELLLALYALATVGVALWQGNGYAVPFLLIYVGGFGYVGLQGLWDARDNLALWLARLAGRQPAAAQRSAPSRSAVAPGRQS